MAGYTLISQHFGDLFDADVEALVNPVNCVGVMGAGLAKKFKEKYPDNFERYSFWCKTGKADVGYTLVYQPLRGKVKYIINFTTKLHWSNNSHIEYIILGLIKLSADIMTYDIKSIAIPALGCGLGGLDWKQVRGVIHEVLKDCDCPDIRIYPPR